MRRRSEGIDSAIERAVAYVEAGADMIFPEAMQSLDDYRRFKAAVKVPILANLTEFGSTPFFTTTNCARPMSTSRCTAAAPIAR